MSSQKYDELDRTISDSKINAVGIEQNLNIKKITKTMMIKIKKVILYKKY